MAMIEHFSIGVADIERAMIFYDAVLAPLGFARVMTLPGEGATHPWASACYGLPDSDPDKNHGDCPFWLEQRPHVVVPDLPGFHICFSAPDRASVHAFHRIGLEHGARDCGAPGLRPHYAADYYAAFLFDPEGWRIEAVTFADH